MAEEVKLFGMWASPFSRRIELALKMKGIQYHYIEEDLSDKSDLLLKYNPVLKKVPVLVHNGKPIAESLIILEYIDETWKHHPIMPEDPYNKAVARFWAKFIDERILVTAIKASAAKEEEKEQIIEEIGEQLKLLESELKEKEYFGGESIGYLDIVALFIVDWFKVRQEIMQIELLNEERFPVLCKWMEKLHGIHVVNKCLPPREEHFAYLKARIESAKSASK
ncbi:glutathione S-transferase U7-like [Ricinus communis]|uniref:glutathione transferase n=1 Tax=Ricinus communis TaxID=3988 RepID=B9S3A6_RICCO|nr:glutathione S-transferase U7-like [Ricinus communis]EEF41888.1 glutathione s-transferase, putative [Ricinus communis]|eukprot:XP_002520475.1 glutathione S-transferase U7-like [Ricinus communis]